jgi:hypothetical protein
MKNNFLGKMISKLVTTTKERKLSMGSIAELDSSIKSGDDLSMASNSRRDLDS